MNKLFAFVAMFSGAVQAAPFLTADPYPADGPLPDSFWCIVDANPGQTFAPIINPDGSRTLKYDLGPLALKPGKHSASCHGTNADGDGGTATLSFVTGAPAAPSGLRLIAK